MERINNQLRVVEDNVELTFPAMEYRFSRDLKDKITMPQVEERLTTKVEKEEFNALVERINELEKEGV